MPTTQLLPLVVFFLQLIEAFLQFAFGYGQLDEGRVLLRKGAFDVLFGRAGVLAPDALIAQAVVQAHR